MKNPTNAKRGFTLIELLTVIAILAILGAIIFPTVGQFRTLAKKSSDSNDLRNIVQASQLFAAQNGEGLVGVAQVMGDGVETVEGGSNTIVDVAAVLAYGGELSDPAVWVSANEPNQNTGTGGLFTQVLDTGTPPQPIPGSFATGDYEASDFSYSYVVGLRTSDSASTPVVFTRMASATLDGWDATDPYDNDGGHIAFLGGNVSWYESLNDQLISPEGAAADNIADAIPTDAQVRQSTDS